MHELDCIKKPGPAYGVNAYTDSRIICRASLCLFIVAQRGMSAGYISDRVDVKSWMWLLHRRILRLHWCVLETTHNWVKKLLYKPCTGRCGMTTMLFIARACVTPRDGARDAIIHACNEVDDELFAFVCRFDGAWCSRFTQDWSRNRTRASQTNLLSVLAKTDAMQFIHCMRLYGSGLRHFSIYSSLFHRTVATRENKQQKKQNKIKQKLN